MRISDGSSDVCSSDLTPTMPRSRASFSLAAPSGPPPPQLSSVEKERVAARQFAKGVMVGLDPTIHVTLGEAVSDAGMDAHVKRGHDGIGIGRVWRRERECQEGESSVVDVTSTK